MRTLASCLAMVALLLVGGASLEACPPLSSYVMQADVSGGCGCGGVQQAPVYQAPSCAGASFAPGAAYAPRSFAPSYYAQAGVFAAPSPYYAGVGLSSRFFAPQRFFGGGVFHHPRNLPPVVPPVGKAVVRQRAVVRGFGVSAALGY